MLRVQEPVGVDWASSHKSCQPSAGWTDAAMIPALKLLFPSDFELELLWLHGRVVLRWGWAALPSFCMSDHSGYLLNVQKRFQGTEVEFRA